MSVKSLHHLLRSQRYAYSRHNRILRVGLSDAHGTGQFPFKNEIPFFSLTIRSQSYQTFNLLGPHSNTVFLIRFIQSLSENYSES